MKTKKRGRGRPPGLPRPGSGKHPLDEAWRARGYVTAAEAAEIAGVTTGTVYAWISGGRVTVEKAGGEKSSAVYLRRSDVEEIRDEGMPPGAA